MNIPLMIISYIAFWCLGFFLHEVGHVWAARLTGGDGKIKIWFYKGIIPSMKTHLYGNYNRDITLIMGGTFTCMLYYLTMLFFTNNHYITFPLYSIGTVNLVYAIYEYKYLRIWDIDKYMKYHYYLYLIVILITTGLYYAIRTFA